MADEKDVKDDGVVDEEFTQFMSNYDDTVVNDSDDVDDQTTDVGDKTTDNVNLNTTNSSNDKGGDDEDELTIIKKQNELLLQRIQEFELANNNPVNTAVSKTAENIINKPDDKKSPIDFLEGMTDDTFEEVFSTKEKFNELLLKVYNRGLEETKSRSSVSENVLQSLPKLVVEYQKRHTLMNKMVTDFYEENDDLKSAKGTVAGMMNKVIAENPNMKVSEALAEAANRTRTILGIKARMNKGKLSPVGDPKLKSKTKQIRNQSSGNKLSGIAKEINDLLTD